MTMERDFNWVGKTGDSNPLNGVIHAVQKLPGEKKPRYLLVVRAAEGFRQMDLFGDNKNLLIERFGEDETKWAGQRVQILTEERIGAPGKTRKIL